MQEAHLKISLITTSYNSAASIRDTIESVLAQDYENIEYIIVDGNSTDHTMDIVHSYGDQITRSISEPDEGLYDALNKGINLAGGDVIGFVHSDDILASRDVIKNIAKTFSEQKTDSVYGDLLYVHKENTAKTLRYWKAGEFSLRKLKRGWMPPHPAFYVKKEIYGKYGKFDLNFKIAADYDSILRFLWKYRISTHYLPEIIVKMRIGGQSNKNIKNILQKSREDIRAMNNNSIQPFPAILIKNISKIQQFFKHA